MDDAPCIVVCLSKAEQTLGTQIKQKLASRGLRVTLVSDAAQLPHQMPFAAICIGVASRMPDPALTDASIAFAMAARRPILPLLLGAERDVPVSLKDMQWSDFTHSFESGWRDLLLALDVEGLSRWPHDPTEFVDAELTFARARNGLIL